MSFYNSNELPQQLAAAATAAAAAATCICYKVTSQKTRPRALAGSNTTTTRTRARARSLVRGHMWFSADAPNATDAADRRAPLHIRARDHQSTTASAAAAAASTASTSRIAFVGVSRLSLSLFHSRALASERRQERPLRPPPPQIFSLCASEKRPQTRATFAAAVACAHGEGGGGSSSNSISCATVLQTLVVSLFELTFLKFLLRPHLQICGH